jgi:alpha,alpha-trehalase
MHACVLSAAAQLMAFLEENFGEAGSDLTQWEPTDLKDDFDLLDRITDPNYKQWAHELNQFWKELGRKFKDEVLQNPQRHSFVPRNEPMVVPGGRFRESYYWDSYWTLQGLLVCEMPETASYVIRNLLLDVVNFG